jgi:AraC-like DNA-binding protein
VKTGRPRIEIDWDTVNRCCEMFCTGEEIASVLGISYDTLQRAVKGEFGVPFAEYYRLKSVGGLVSLRRAQFQLAMSGNPTMLIWLGKQRLGQKDTQYQAHSGDLTVRRVQYRFDGSVQEPST